MLCYDSFDHRILHGRLRHFDKISCRRIGSVISAPLVQPDRIVKMAVHHAKSLRLLIHPHHEILLTSCSSLCESHCRACIRYDQKHMKILLYRIGSARLQVQCRSIGRNHSADLFGIFDLFICDFNKKSSSDLLKNIFGHLIDHVICMRRCLGFCCCLCFCCRDNCCQHRQNKQEYDTLSCILHLHPHFRTYL